MRDADHDDEDDPGTGGVCLLSKHHFLFLVSIHRTNIVIADSSGSVAAAPADSTFDEYFVLMLLLLWSNSVHSELGFTGTASSAATIAGEEGED